MSSETTLGSELILSPSTTRANHWGCPTWPAVLGSVPSWDLCFWSCLHLLRGKRIMMAWYLRSYPTHTKWGFCWRWYLRKYLINWSCPRTSWPISVSVLQGHWNQPKMKLINATMFIGSRGRLWKYYVPFKKHLFQHCFISVWPYLTLTNFLQFSIIFPKTISQWTLQVMNP